MTFFLHMHKAGGTTLCQTARAAGLVTETFQLRPDWDSNCVPRQAFTTGRATARGLPVDDAAIEWRGAACWIQETGARHQRDLPALLPGLDFIASEGALPDRLALHAPVSRITMLREPLSRTLSSFHWWGALKEAWGADSRLTRICQCYAAPHNATLDEWIEAFPSDFQTRSLLGRRYLYSRAPLTAEDFADAVERLRYFSAVLLLERFDESLELLRRRLGWRGVGDGDEAPSQVRAGSRRGTRAEDELQDRPHLLARLMERHVWDRALYDEAVRLFERQLHEEGVTGEG